MIISTIYKIYSQILELYNSDNRDQILINIHENSKKFYEFYKYLKCNKQKKDKLDYSYSLEKSILNSKNEKDNIMKSKYIILSLHKIVYEIIKKHTYKKLSGKNEMYALSNDIEYYIYVCKDEEKNKYFHAYFIIYALESIFNKNLFVGVDFEYTYRKIKLFQMNFEHNISSESMIMIVNPNDLNNILIDIINMIFCNRRIKKIFHGGEALDIPYIYEELLGNDYKKIIKFTKSMIDTRYPCEYYKLNKSIEPDDKCSIYTATLYFGLINEKKLNELDDMQEREMPHHNTRDWNIKILSDPQIMYAQYDVLFLKYFYFRMIYCAKSKVSKDIKLHINVLYKHILYELTQIGYLDRNKKIFILKTCQDIVNPLNNYMVKSGGNVYKLIDIFKLVFSEIIVHDPYCNIDNIIKVNYYKNIMVVLIKMIIYTTIVNNYKVLKDKNNIFNEKIDKNIIPNFLEELKFKYLKNIFLKIFIIIDDRLRAMKID